MKHILVVDDVTTNLICATEILKDDYEVITAKSARAALEFINSSKPDLVITDVYMPQEDGFWLYKKIKDNRDSADIPVVFCTAENSKEVREKAVRLGTDYIRKPYSPESLSETVRTAFRRQELANGKQVSGDADSVRPQQKNAEQLRARLNDDKVRGYLVLLSVDSYSRIFDVFGEDMTDDVFSRMEKVLDEELGKEHLVCYCSGDIFAFYIDAAISVRHVRTLMRRVIAGIEFEINEELLTQPDFRLSLSAGIAVKPEDGQNFDSLRECADKALYYLRQSGKRGYHFYSTKPDVEADYKDVQNVLNIEQAERLLKRNMRTASDITLSKAYQILVRCLNDKRECSQLILFSLSGADKENRTEIVEIFDRVITSSLRKGDAAFACDSGIQLVVLSEASSVNGEMVADRIRDKFRQMIGDDSVDLNYEMRGI